VANQEVVGFAADGSSKAAFHFALGHQP
jgi:hypothetical protein